MSIFDDFDFEDREYVDTFFDMGDIEHVYLTRDDGLWEMSIELEDGRIIDLDYQWTDEEAQDEIWGEYYWDFIGEGIDVDVEVAY
jgi:hypothetical protein